MRMTLALLLTTLTTLARATSAPVPPALATPPKIADGTCRVLEDAWEFDCRPLDEADYCVATLRQTVLGECLIELDPMAPATLDGKAMVPTVAGGRLFGIPAGRHELVARSELRIEPHVERGTYVERACEIRHLFLHVGDRDTSFAVGISPSPVAALGEGYRATLAVTPPEDLEWRSAPTLDPERGTPWARNGRVWTTTFSPRPGDETLPYLPTAAIARFGRPETPIHAAGPQLALGMSLLDGTEAFRVRAEYEFGIDGFILPGVSLDADTEMGFLVTPRVEFATPMIVIIPSVSAGLGMPISLEKSPDLGLRIYGGLQFGPVGFVASHDWFPAKGRADETSLLLRVSL